jgi:1-aminocyclopropane-1-carboxylate deaminase/D-cysteine desulfhydrase-like pyridoxal-dependent ACC family enzyme
METRRACCRCGVKPVLFLYALIDPSEEDLRGNMLLDRLYGAEIHITSRRRARP